MNTTEWNAEVARLEQFFKEYDLPKTLKTREGFIFDLNTYISTALARAKAHAGNKTFITSITSLQEIEKMLSA